MSITYNPDGDSPRDLIHFGSELVAKGVGEIIDLSTTLNLPADRIIAHISDFIKKYIRTDDKCLHD